MTPFIHRSPIRFKTAARHTHLLNGWEVVAVYEGEGKGPFLADLSHVEKWEIRDPHPERMRPLDLAIPQQPGTCRITAGALMARMTPDRILFWHLSGDRPEMPFSEPYAALTDARALLLLWGDSVLDILSGVVAADLSDPRVPAPFCRSVSLVNIPAEMIVLESTPETAAALLSVDRGWGREVADRLLEAGFSPAGRTAWLQRLGHQLGIEQPRQG